MEVEQSSIDFKLEADKRPTMPEPPPVRLVAIEDIHLPSPAGLEVQLDDFYMNVLRFERESSPPGEIIYKSENFRLVFTVLEPPLLRHDMRPLGIELPTFAGLEQLFIDREIEYERQRGLMTGQETLLLQDPAGNWVQIGEFVRV